MNDTELLTCTLVSYAIGGKAPTIPADADLKSILAFSKRHGVAVLVSYALHNLDFPLGEFASAFQKEESGALFRDTAMDIGTQEIVDKLHEAGVTYMLLKGSVMKALYPEPYLRSMCDIDIKYDTSKIDAVRAIMKELGYQLYEQSGTNGVNLCFKRHPVMTVEMHGVLMDRDIPLYNAYFGTDFERTVSVDGLERRFSDEDFFVFMTAHLAKHYYYGGTGVRSLADIRVYLDKKPDLDMDYIRAELKKLDLDVFLQHILRLCDYLFGDHEGDELTESMAEYIFDSNTYGTVENALTSQVGKDKNGFILRRLFPPTDFMSVRYPVLKKLPVLLPLFWLIRLIVSLFSGAYRSSDVKAAVNQSQASMDARLIEGRPIIDKDAVKGDIIDNDQKK